MTTDNNYLERIDAAQAETTALHSRMATLLAALYSAAEHAGVEHADKLAPDKLLDALTERIDILRAKADEHDAPLAEALRTIGYNDTEIAQCLYDVPDLTMADIDYAHTFAEEIWDETKAVYNYGNYPKDARIRIMPKVDYTAVTCATAIFQGLTNIAYIPTLDWPNVTAANYAFHKLAGLRRIPQVNAPEAIEISALYANHGGVRSLPPVISHPKVTNIANLFNGITVEAYATVPPLDLNFDIITNAANLFVNSEIDTFPLTKFGALVSLSHLHWAYDVKSNIKGDQSHIKWDIPHATKVDGMFFRVAATAIDVSGIKTAECTSFQACFDSSGFEHLDVSTWDMSGADDVVAMFRLMPNLQTLNFSNKRFKTGCIISSLFYRCINLQTLNLSDVDFTGTKLTSAESTFGDLPSLETIIGPVTGIGWSADLGKSSMLTPESAMVIINGLAEASTTTGLYLHTNTYNKLTPEQIAIATAKGWTVYKQ